jgi:hypothetical protein
MFSKSNDYEYNSHSAGKLLWRAIQLACETAHKRPPFSFLSLAQTHEPLAKFIDRVIFPPLEGASLSPSVKPEPA